MTAALARGVLARLAAATAVEVEVASGAGWSGTGRGTVTAERDGGAVVVSEAGTWAPSGARPMRWTAESRWWAEGDALALEHRRPGVSASAVLDWTGRRWTARAPHVCPPDAYDVTLAVEGGQLVVAWTVTGPRKSDRVVTRYR